MLAPAFYVMAILGCGEAEAPCQQVAMVESRFESAEACNAATPSAIEQHSDAAFPVVVAQCQQAGSLVSSQVMPEEIKLPEPQQLQQRQAPRIQRALFVPQRPRKS